MTSAHLREASGFDSSASCAPASGRIERPAGAGWPLQGASGGGGSGSAEATLSSWAPVFSLIIDDMNTRIDDMESSSRSGKRELEDLQKETDRLRLLRQDDQRQLAELQERLQQLESPKDEKRKNESFTNADMPLGETCKPDTENSCQLTPNPFENFSFFSYLRGELHKGVYAETEEKKYAMQEGKVKGLFYTPLELEKFMIYGLLHCFDSFLYLYTLLPLRVLLALASSFKNGLVSYCFGKLNYFGWNCDFDFKGGHLTPSQWLDLIRFFIIVPTVAIFYYMDTSVFNFSVLYHLIRTQTFVKLYFLYNMIDICDRLFSSVGQDLFDAITYYVAVRKNPKWSTAVVVYAASLAVQSLHCGLTMLQYTILLVAFNSHNKVLLILMLSNNFGELKSTVFKRFSSNNLFQMSCADVRERFQYILLLMLVLVRVMQAYDWEAEKMSIFLQDSIVILLIEVLIDWIKMSFITKFNDISYQVYAEYTRSLAYDLLNLGPGQQREHFDHICRRMGLTPIPLACIVTSVLMKTVPPPPLYLLALFPILFLLKLGCHLLLLQQSYEKVHAFELKQHQTCPGASSSAELSLTSLARRSHRRTRSQFDLPLRRDRLDTLLSSETSASEVPAPKLSDSESETLLPGQQRAGGDHGSSSGTLFDEGSSDGGEATPLAAVKRSRSLTAVPEPFEGCRCAAVPPVEALGSAESELRCRVRANSGVSEVTGAPGVGEPREDVRCGGSPVEGGQMPLSDVHRYSMCSSQIV